jgi:hypothetical protein
MTLEVFKPRTFQAAALRTIEAANAIIAEYEAQGFTLTLRQLHYQFVARDLHANTPENYKRLGVTLLNARDAGLSSWSAIEDRTRSMNDHAAWDSPADIITEAARSYREDPWRGQGHRVEVWVEKDALVGVIAVVCDEYRVPYCATRGNYGQIEIYKAGKRFADHIADGLTPTVLHLADHDPTGIDMTRDCADRLSLYARADVEVRRIALNIDQVRRYRPPPNFVKEGDSRTGDYRRRFGTDDCWELDALAPDVIADLIRDEVVALIDEPAWRRALRKEAKARRELAAAAEGWPRPRSR